MSSYQKEIVEAKQIHLNHILTTKEIFVIKWGFFESVYVLFCLLTKRVSFVFWTFDMQNEAVSCLNSNTITIQEDKAQKNNQNIVCVQSLNDKLSELRNKT